MQISSMHALGLLQIGTFDVRVAKALQNLQSAFGSNPLTQEDILQLVEIFHHFNASRILTEILPHFLCDLDFIPTSILARMTRIYFKHCRVSSVWNVFCTSIMAHLKGDIGVASLDDILTCALACAYTNVGLEASFVVNLLEKYISNVNNQQPDNLKLTLTAMRLHLAMSYKMNFWFESFVRTSIDVIQEYVGTNPSSSDNEMDLVRGCYIASRICLLKGEFYNLPKIVQSSWMLIQKNDPTIENTIYMLATLKVIGYRMDETMTEITRVISTQTCNMTASDFRGLIKYIDTSQISIICPLFSLLSHELNGNDLTSFLRILSWSGVHVSDTLKIDIVNQFLRMCGEMPAKDCTKCISYMATMGLCNEKVVRLFVRHLKSFALSLGLNDIANCLHVFKKFPHTTPQNIVHVWAEHIVKGVQDLETSGLIKCLGFAARFKKHHAHLFETLIQQVQNAIDEFKIQQLIAISTILVGYKRYPLVGMLYSRIFAEIPNMNINDICLAYWSWSQSGNLNPEYVQRFERYLLPHLEHLNDRQVSLVMSRIETNTEAFKDAVRTTCKMPSVDSFIVFNNIIDVSQLSITDVIRCILSLGGKKRTNVTDQIARQLYVRLFDIVPTLPMNILDTIFTSIQEYGYMKPKIKRLLSNALIIGKQNKSVHVAFPKGDHCIFRHVSKGPPHFLVK
ncbi:hypothetical protein BdWA1_000754 [Babesia duncani]|uniref:Uncharacterized protein n=1 Tax=Babesia duncani TaxID=323732 RepID=A0AAD9PND3_9APIC|nr:hypothetical protein BdWA1_000754 [Babesia duncani]